MCDAEPFRKGNWVKLVSILKRQFNEWAEDRLQQRGHSDFKMVYMPVIMNISSDGTSNGELAAHCRVSKQAMSKLAKELQDRGYIRTKTDPDDKRSTIFMLTERGKSLVIGALECVGEITSDYRRLVGVKDFEQATAVLNKILKYNDEFLLKK